MTKRQIKKLETILAKLEALQAEVQSNGVDEAKSALLRALNEASN